MKKFLRKLLCMLNIHFKDNYSYDPWEDTEYCAYCRKKKL